MPILASLTAGLLLLQAAPPTPARAPATAVPAPPVAGEEEGESGQVVVTGRRQSEAERRKAISDFVREQSAPTRGRLARWDVGVCPGVVGLPEKYGTYLADRIAAEALAVGLDVGEPGCTPDILVLFTSDPAGAAEDFRRKYQGYFADKDRQGDRELGGGGQKLKDFLKSGEAVRWWHVSHRAASDGRPVGGGLNLTTGASRLRSLWSENLSRILIIVDSRRMKGVTYEALAGYLSMVALAQLDPAAEPGELPTVMTLFRDRDAGRPSAESLTSYDRAFLAGLYASADDANGLTTQRGAIRRSLDAVDR